MRRISAACANLSLVGILGLWGELDDPASDILRDRGSVSRGPTRSGTKSPPGWCWFAVSLSAGRRRCRAGAIIAKASLLAWFSTGSP